MVYASHCVSVPSPMARYTAVRPPEPPGGIRRPWGWTSKRTLHGTLRSTEAVQTCSNWELVQTDRALSQWHKVLRCCAGLQLLLAVNCILACDCKTQLVNEHLQNNRLYFISVQKPFIMEPSHMSSFNCSNQAVGAFAWKGKGSPTAGPKPLLILKQMQEVKHVKPFLAPNWVKAKKWNHFVGENMYRTMNMPEHYLLHTKWNW